MKRFIYDTLADSWMKNSSVNIFLYSDPHFGDLDSYIFRFVTNQETIDGKIYYQTGAATWEDIDSLKQSQEEFDKTQVKNINAKVGRNDVLIVLGDVGDLNWVKKLRGYKILIMGNHDEGSASKYKRQVITIPTFGEASEEEKTKILANASKLMANPQLLENLPEDKNFHQKVEDNHLFDEVYEGPLMINSRVLLSHEPVEVPDYMYNIHGHIHNANYKGNDHHLNCCAESINYQPVSLISLFKDGLLHNITDIHRVCINRATYAKFGNL